MANFQSTVFDHLSERQKAVLRLVAQGFSSKEIGRVLGISAHTVDAHVVEARRRLGERSRAVTARRFVAWEAVAGGRRSASPATASTSAGDLPRDVGRRPFGISPPAANGSGFRYPRGKGKDSLHARRYHSQQTDVWNAAMLRVVVRFFMDTICVGLFFLCMSAFAYLSHLLVKAAEAAAMDDIVILILSGVEILLAASDGLGVVFASGFLTYRFITALMQAESPGRLEIFH